MRSFTVIGLTGPTGAGKGAVCRVFLQENYGIVDTDRLAREVVRPGTDCLKQLAEAFSPSVLNGDGTLNRRELARRAFASPAEQAKLNAITHPAILALCEREVEQLRAAGKRGAVIDAPLLLESGLNERCQKVLAVLAPEEMRLSRLLIRDALPEEELRRRMAAQQPDDFYAAKADAVITNDGDIAALEQQVRAVIAAWEAGEV